MTGLAQERTFADVRVMSAKFGSTCPNRSQKIGQKDLAAMAGIARETVNRILSDWKRRKLISWASGYYWIENKAQLQNEAEL
jgi:CRP-like cAMP-binding protein